MRNQSRQEIQRYLQEAQSNASKNYANANGNMPMAYANAGGSSLANTPNQAGTRFGFAGGNMGGMPSGVKQYIIQVANTNTFSVSNVSVLFASNYLFGGYAGSTWTAAGSLTFASGVTISAVSSAVTYQQILTSLITTPIAVGSVYLKTVGSSSNVSQISDPYTVTSVSPRGERYTADKFPIISPNQFQSGISYNNDDFNVDALTGLTWGTVYGSTTFQITLYIATDVNPANAINGANVQQNYGAPTNLAGTGGY